MEEQREGTREELVLPWGKQGYHGGIGKIKELNVFKVKMRDINLFILQIYFIYLADPVKPRLFYNRGL